MTREYLEVATGKPVSQLQFEATENDVSSVVDISGNTVSKMLPRR